MANKTFQGRIVQKHDTKANWDKATNFVPLKGEIIVYDDLKKIKIGDGATKVGSLAFINDLDTLAAIAKTGSYNDLKNKPTIPTKLSNLTDDVVKGKYLPLAGGTMTGNIDLGEENIKMSSSELGTSSILNGNGLFVVDNNEDKYVKIGVSSYGGIEGAYYSIGNNEDIGDKIIGRIYLNNFACQAADDVPESLANVGYVKNQLANNASTTIITWSDDGT